MLAPESHRHLNTTPDGSHKIGSSCRYFFQLVFGLSNLVRIIIKSVFINFSVIKHAKKIFYKILVSQFRDLT